LNTAFEDIKKWNPDGIMLSNGPGDPSALTQPIKTAKEIIASSLPAFGICLGHQVIALACDLKTYKMHNGHRGVNHPVKNLKTGKCEITSQNHGFVVDMADSKSRKNIEVTHVHLNDNTLAGLKIKGKKIFSVQFHPEASAGPNDSRYLFDDFIKLLNNKSKSPQLEEAKLSNS
jgi:carbamoyl-phosphate synthase small subunit